jgi:hypothetical protein
MMVLVQHRRILVGEADAMRDEGVPQSLKLLRKLLGERPPQLLERPSRPHLRKRFVEELVGNRIEPPLFVARLTSAEVGPRDIGHVAGRANEVCVKRDEFALLHDASARLLEPRVRPRT